MGEDGRPHLEAVVHPVASLPHLLHGDALAKAAAASPLLSLSPWSDSDPGDARGQQ